MSLSLNFTRVTAEFARPHLDDAALDEAAHAAQSSGPDRATATLTPPAPDTSTSFLMKDGVILPPHW